MTSNQVVLIQVRKQKRLQADRVGGSEISPALMIGEMAPEWVNELFTHYSLVGCHAR